MSVLTAQIDPILAAVPGPGLLFGLMLVAAIVGGYLARALRIPRVVGYLLAGVALRLLLYGLLRIEPDSAAEAELAAAAAPLKAVKDLALGMILFSIGAVFETRHLKAVGRRIFRIALGESGLTCLLVFAGTVTVGLAITEGVPPAIVVCFALLLAFASIATAPAATLFVLREYGAKGPVTDTILSLTGVNNVVCIVTFHVCFLLLATTGALGDVALSTGSAWIDLGTTTLGSLALGLVLGCALSIIHAKLQLGDTLLILIATLILLGAGEGWLLEHHSISFNFLLTALAMGATCANVAIDPGRLDEALGKLGQPVLVGFFVIAGFQLHLGDLSEFGWIGAAYVICRLLGKVLGAYLGLRGREAARELSPYLGAALLCQAAVVLGLADFVTAYWQHAWAEKFATVVLGSVVIFEICGPLLAKWVVVRSGEVKAVTLLRRTGSTLVGSASVVALTWEAILRTVGLGTARRSIAAETLLVRHVMRRSVKCLPATADLDDVMHFMERSRFNHFPVVDEHDELVGVIHFSDIREMIYDPALSRLMTAVDLSNPDTNAVPADMPIEDAVHVFRDGDVGSLPVVETADSRNVVGILEQRDVLRALHQFRIKT